MKDNLLVYQNFDNLDLTCYLCKKKNHVAINCTILGYLNDHKLFLKNYFDLLAAFRYYFIQIDHLKGKIISEDRKESVLEIH